MINTFSRRRTRLQRFDIFKALCSVYEDAAMHGDPYYILNYLMALKYKEASDLNKFVYDPEDAMKAASDATNSVMRDVQETIYLYHSLSEAWKAERQREKGSWKYIPYEELKRHIETKVRNKMARNRYVLKQGTSESRKTRAEKALQGTAEESLPAPHKAATALMSTLKCTYCYGVNHDTVDCYTLQ